MNTTESPQAIATTPSSCDNILPYITAPEATGGVTSYRFYVQLWSLQTDEEGEPVDYQMLDVLVTEPSFKAIAQLLRAAGWLDQWQVVDYWMPDAAVPF
jgi:hypothetical protein